MARKHDRQRPARRPHHFSRLSVEPLESRTLLSLLELTALGDRGITITKTGPYESWVQPAAGVGDVNGDGYGDFLLVFDPLRGGGGESLQHQAFLFYGRPAFPTVLDVNTWEPDVTFSGPSALTVAAAGDVNGDGFADLLIGAPNATVNGRAYSGIAFLVFGSRTLLPDIDLLDLGPAGVAFSGSLPTDARPATGYRVGGAGDVNNDGYDDVLIGGAALASWTSSRVYLVYGSAILPEAMDLTVPQSGVRTIITQPKQDRCIYGPSHWIGSLAGAGDVNGDGFDDVLLGTELPDLCGSEVYLLYGARSLPAIIELNAIDSLGVRLHPDGHSLDVHAAGDVDRDGYADILVGSDDFTTWHGGCGSHLSVLVYGSPSLPNEVIIDRAGCSVYTREVGTRVSFLPHGQESSGSVSGAGDTNGDGFADILLGIAPGEGIGHVAVILGGDNLPLEITRSVASDPAGSSLVIRGTPVDGTGTWVGTAGDINGDQLADYFISASSFGVPDAPPFGRLYLVFGRDVQGPRVESATPSGPLAAGSRGVRRIGLSFSEAIDPLTFTTDDITLVGPAGSIHIRRIRQISDTVFRIRFPQQTALGEYHLTLGPDVTDLAGNPMDQDGDGQLGEHPEDAFTSTFRIVPRTFVFFFTGRNAPAEGSGMEKLRGAIAGDPVLSKLHVLAPVFGWPEGTRPKTQRLAAQAFVQSFLTSQNADRVQDRVVLVGHSYGGNIAYLIAPDLDLRGPGTAAASGLVLFDPIDWRLCAFLPPAVDCNQSNNPRPLPRNVAGNHVVNFLQRRFGIALLKGFPIETARNDDRTGQGPDGRWGTPLDPSPDDTTHTLIDNDWSPGSDGKSGFANVDDDRNGKIDDDTEAGFPGSDDAVLGTHAIALDFLLELARQ